MLVLTSPYCMAYMYLDSLAINYIDSTGCDSVSGMCILNIYLFCKPTLYVGEHVPGYRLYLVSTLYIVIILQSPLICVALDV